MADRYAVTIIKQGRSGTIRYREGLFHRHEFYWEYGGSEQVVMLIRVPSPAEWPHDVRWAADRRDEVLTRVAREVAREGCPGCGFSLGDVWLHILAPASAAPAP